MTQRSCSECGGTAEVSLCQIISTVGRTPRFQRCSKATAFCAACLQSRLKLLRRLGLRGIHRPLGEAFTELAERSAMNLSHSKRRASAVPVPNAVK